MATYYIATTGNDSTGSGTQIAPWLTVSKAVSSSAPGDTIIAAAGTYTWVAQASTNGRIFVGAGAGLTIFDGAAATNVYWQVPNWTISGVTFQNGSSPTGAGFATFQNQNAVAASTSFISCIFNAIGGAGGNEGVFEALNATWTLSFIGCLFRNCTGANNTFSGNRGVMALSLTNCTLYTNILAVNTLSVVLSASTITVALINSIFYNANGTPVAFKSGGGTVSYSGSNNDIIGYTTTPSLASQLSVDPLFVDPANGNFNLRPGSPCIDAGTPI